MSINKTVVEVGLSLSAVTDDGAYLLENQIIRATAILETSTIEDDEASLNLQIMLPKQLAEQLLAGLQVGFGELLIENIPNMIELSVSRGVL